MNLDDAIRTLWRKLPKLVYFRLSHTAGRDPYPQERDFNLITLEVFSLGRELNERYQRKAGIGEVDYSPLVATALCAASFWASKRVDQISYPPNGNMTT